MSCRGGVGAALRPVVIRGNRRATLWRWLDADAIRPSACVVWSVLNDSLLIAFGGLALGMPVAFMSTTVWRTFLFPRSFQLRG